MTMPTPAEDAALSAFIDAATSDDDPGTRTAPPSSLGSRPRRPIAFCGATSTKVARPSLSAPTTWRC